MNCSQPGCAGSFDQGYCNQCGAPQQPTLSSTNEGPLTCTTAGCHGTIEDGYCNQCGAPAAVASSPMSAALAGHSTRTSSLTSARLAAAPLGSARIGASGSRPTRRIASSTSATSHLGAGLTKVAPSPTVDPVAALMKDPIVPEAKRFCPSCEGPVGRTHDGRQGRTEGFCPSCGAAFSFTPKLERGDLVGGQYEVLGPIAHGGLGWIYLARDRNVSDRYVVLKGLLNTGDDDAFAAAVAERQFLAEVSHPLVVEIYNFAEFEGSGYTVMEYVGGKSLKQLLKAQTEAAGTYTPFSAATAIAYIIEILSAFSYLHSLGLIYCDFKPDNIIQVGEAVKLIDLGGVRRVDDITSAIYGTVGYQAPEVADVGPSVASDIYTIGRTLMVLAAEFRGFQSEYLYTLPKPEGFELFARYESLHRLIAKACAPDPADRFSSADEMRDQLIGVLRQVVAIDAGTTAAVRSAPSPLFSSPQGSPVDLDVAGLPTLAIDQRDSAAGWIAQVSVTEPHARLAVFDAAPQATPEVELFTAAASVAVDPARAIAMCDAILAANPWDWRAMWVQGCAQLAAGDAQSAVAAFNAVADQIPGELAPKLALGLACERSGRPEQAAEMYAVCAAVDADYLTVAMFSLARVRDSLDDHQGALEALTAVPVTSSGYSEAAKLRAQLLCRSGKAIADYDQAYAAAASVADPVAVASIEAQALYSALIHVGVYGPVPATVGGVAAEEIALRLAAEQAYRRMAKLADGMTRIECVDAANRIRPRTKF